MWLHYIWYRIKINPPPPLAQATVNDQKLAEPTSSVAWTKVLLTLTGAANTFNNIEWVYSLHLRGGGVHTRTHTQAHVCQTTPQRLAEPQKRSLRLLFFWKARCSGVRTLENGGSHQAVEQHPEHARKTYGSTTRAMPFQLLDKADQNWKLGTIHDHWVCIPSTHPLL